MWLLFRSKHKKLVLRCFPSGKLGETEPNGSPLAYLSYYAASNSSKLRKVAHFLGSRVRHSYYHKRDNEVIIGLKICKTLVQKCRDNINVMASEVVNMLLVASSSKNLEVLSACVDCFATFCDNSGKGSPATFGNEFHSAFNNLVNSFFELSKGIDCVDPQQSKMLGLKAFHALTACKFAGTEGGMRYQPHFAIHCVLINSWSESDQEKKSFIDLVRSTAKSYKPLPPSSTGVSLPEHDEAGDNIDVAIKKLCIRILFNIYTQTDPLFMAESTKSLIHFFAAKSDTPVNLEYISVVLNQILDWTPVELRHSIFFCCLRCLSSSRIVNSETNVMVPYMIYSILNSKNSISGLSVIDVLRDLGSHLINAVNSFDADDQTWYNMCESPSEKLPRRLYLLLVCITCLTKHQYYDEEFADVWREIDTLANSETSSAIQMVALTAFHKLQNEKLNTKKESSAPLSLVTDFLLHSWPKSAERLHTSQSPFVRIKTAEVFYEFLCFLRPSLINFDTILRKSAITSFSVLWDFIYETSWHIERWLKVFSVQSEFYILKLIIQRLYQLYGPVSVTAVLPAMYRGLRPFENDPPRCIAEAVTAYYIIYIGENLKITTLQSSGRKWLDSLSSSLPSSLLNRGSSTHSWEKLTNASTEEVMLPLDMVVNELLEKSPKVFPEDSRLLFAEQSRHPKYTDIIQKLKKPSREKSFTSSSEYSLPFISPASDYQQNPLLHATKSLVSIHQQSQRGEMVSTLKQALSRPHTASTVVRSPSEINLTRQTSNRVPLLDMLNLNRAMSPTPIQSPPYVRT
ncbi:phosphatidylinositol-4 kinase plasma membrane scaffold Efr3 [Schizosaccharomyces pombe]|uniref:Protein efr3 n=1 Tax=Schizosaccharomyces pombe (strain 972 / ATCC 24843) TaxID=284812 RepID=EFR3_SCHPO|nr:protein efr3 [Schizosaccharomyces pombe]O59817.1 RecName: Full=Protein efr3 [Schizosaccharomyces pombe 972h-]CAA19135.1 HEAT repeat protein, involved in localization to plasma membrane (predicted) [Schizosaccharomyces pombe]|eukprot:NP_587756.1 protein efr3 [Schizosaccharomyces pombe]